MSDPLRTDSSRALDAPDADRDAKIEQLLLVGLDHYFSAHYEQAINVWTRALFLDRSHPKARAYIERARTALAERQRETDELLQSGIAAFERGEGVEARQLLQTALGRGAPADEALAVLDRLDRLEHGAVQAQAPDTRDSRGRRARSPIAGLGMEAHPRSAAGVVVAAVVALGIAAGGYAAFVWWRPASRSFAAADVLDVFGLLAPGSSRAAASPEPPQAELALPRRAEGALARARILEAGGRLHDALAALDAIRLTDPEHADADHLRAEIQRQLVSLPSTGASRIP